MRLALLACSLSLACATTAPAPPGPDATPAVADAAVIDAAASACGAADAPRGVQRRTITVGGQTRSYVLFVPDGYRPGTPLPLIFGWHGLGGSGMQFRSAHGLEAAANGAALFVYPDGLPQANFFNAPGWDLRPEGDVRLFDALLAELEGAYCVDRGRVFSTGHSFGGYLTNTLGCLRPGVLRAIAPVAGGLMNEGCESKPLPAWLTHAMNDPVVPFAAGEAARDHWKAAARCGPASRPVEPEGCVTYEGCAVPVQWCVHQQRHDWPAFASAAIWKFFDQLR
jgi:polyhydroxybutyrate depolymerase